MTAKKQPGQTRKKNHRFLVFIPYAAVVLLLVLAEAALRLWRPDLENPIVKDAKYDGIEWYDINRGYLKKYFPPNTILIPEFKSQLFRKQKQANTYRVFCLGESSMFGTPYQMTANIPGIVRKQLRHLFPEKEIEVVNWGASAINTNVISDLSRQLMDFHPDLVLVYAGHNEFYGPDGIGASFLERHFPSLTSFKYQLRDLRLVTLLFNAFQKGSSTGETPADLNLMKQVSQGSLVRLNSTDAQRTFSAFEKNLTSIVRTWKNAGVPVIVSDVSSNLMFPPFMFDSLNAVPGAPELFRGVVADYNAGENQAAIDKLQKLQALDSANAFVHYWLGRTMLAEGKMDSSRRHLTFARDYDLLKFRAPSTINEIIRRVCAEEEVACASADSTLSAVSQHGIPGDRLFWEHLHPNVEGYYHIASLFVNRTVQAVEVSKIKQNSSMQLLSFDLDSLSICWLDLAYGDLSVQHLTGRWPFTDYHRELSAMKTADQTLIRTANKAYSRQVSWDEACYSLAAYFWRNGEVRNAITTYEALLEEYPYNFYTNYLLGNLLVKEGKKDEGMRFLRLSIASNPDYPNSRLDLGLNEINAGNFDSAIKELTRAIALAAEQRSASAFRANLHYGLAAAYANKSDFKRARDNIDQALKLVPNYPEALALRRSLDRADR